MSYYLLKKMFESGNAANAFTPTTITKILKFYLCDPTGINLKAGATNYVYNLGNFSNS